MKSADLLQLRDVYMSRVDAKRDLLTQQLRKKFDKDLGGGSKSIDAHIQQHLIGRVRLMFHTIFPWIGLFSDLPGATIYELGPGTGATTSALGMVAKAVRAYDISSDSSDIARSRCSLLGIENVLVEATSPERLLARIVEDAAHSPPTIIFMFAVLEHMTLSERLTTLKTCWEQLADGGLLVIGDTPNRLVYRHGHTSREPFFDMVPDELMAHFADQFPNRDFGEALSSWRTAGQPDTKISSQIDRWGRGVSFHEFEIAIGSVSTHLIASGLESPITRAMPLVKEEILLMRFLSAECPNVPLGFGRASLYLILRKGNSGSARRELESEELLRQALSLM